MTGQSAEDVIYFVLTEAARFQEQFARGDFRTGLERPFDALHSIPSANGKGGGLCIGPEAELKLREFVEARLSKTSYSARVEFGPLLQQFKQEIVDRFVNRGAGLSDDEVDRAFEHSLSQSVSRVKELTHLLPCQLVNPNNPGTFTIGPVKFSHFDIFWSDVSAALNARYESAPDREHRVKQIASYYAEFNWIAEITLSGWEMALSRRQALAMAKTAVEGLRLLLGGRHSNRLLVAGAASGNAARSHVVLSAGRIEQTEVGLYSSIYHVDEESWKGIESEYIGDLRRSLGAAITYSYVVPVPMPFATRFTDALHWYGLATEDTSAAAKLVMYLMAVERLLVPIDVGDIQSTVQKRSAYFCGWAKHGRRVKKIYDARNHLAHGKCSPVSPEIAPAAEVAHEFARQVLLGILRESEAAFGNSGFGPKQLVTALDNAYEEQKRRGMEQARTRVE